MQDDAVTTTYTARDKRLLLERINTLSKTGHEEIFKICAKHNIPFSENSNGCFFKLSGIPDEIIAEIIQSVDYNIVKGKEAEEYAKLLNECKINNNFNALVTSESMQPNGVLGVGDGEINGIDVAAFIAIERERKAKSRNATDVIKLITENQNNEKLQSFVKVMTESSERIHKKKMNSKYMNARKAFSRRCADRKVDFEGGNNLTFEQYPI